MAHGVAQMLPLAKKYFYISLNEAITMNEIKWATLVSQFLDTKLLGQGTGQLAGIMIQPDLPTNDSL